ncbi:bifunctional diguanylate cyclase/phosphodiesterase [Actinoplanes octamycinicus]|nr:hypothetical protein Aoc01nite_52940 [Actinoplanes octamycinicus]
MLRRRLWWIALAAGVAAIGGYYLLPAVGLTQSVSYNAVGWIYSLLILVGIRLHRPDRPAVWYFFLFGQLMSVSGDAVWNFYVYVLHQEPFPSAADLLYLSGYPLLAAGFVRLVGQHRDRDPRALLDAAIVATGTGLVFWVFVLHPAAAAAADTMLERAINTAYPAADVLLLAILAGLFAGSRARHRSARLLGAAAVLLLMADVGYSSLGTVMNVDQGGPLDGLWLLSYVLWGVAALHPSMGSARTEDNRLAGRLEMRRGRQVLLTGSTLLAPAILFLPGVSGRRGDWMVAAGGAVVLFLLVSARVSGFLKQIQRQAGDLETLALHDELTGLANRRHFQGQLHAALATGPCSVALLDLTGFKKVNDKLGHHAGDRLLAEVAERLTVAAGDVASVARMGGDEFAFLIPDAHPEAAVRIAERVGRQLARPIRVAGQDLLIRANLGLAGTSGAEPLEALRRADVAMYAAKEAGEPFRWYDPELDRSAGEDARIGAELRTALDAGHLRLVYQPIVELPTGRLIAVEALVRWHHPERGLISPAEFVPVAERDGTIVELGAWILHEACRQAAIWRTGDDTDAPQRVSVNVSARQLARPGFAETVRAALTGNGLPAAALTIEVTETAVFEGGRSLETLHTLNEMGVRIALDDFGTGHSSLTLLQTVPAHALKVDKSFVDHVTAGGRPAVIAATLIKVADGLGMAAVAEGVETAEQAAELHRLGYQLAQGYYFGRPAENPVVVRQRQPAAIPGK